MSIGSKKSAALSYMPPPRTNDSTRLESYIPLSRAWEGFCANLSLFLGFFLRCFDFVDRAFLVGVRRESEARDLLVTSETHNDHALRRTPEPLDLRDPHPDDRAAVRDQHQLRALVHSPRAGKLPTRLRELHGLDAEAAAALDRVVGDASPLAVALVGHDQDVVIFARDRGRD